MPTIKVRGKYLKCVPRYNNLSYMILISPVFQVGYYCWANVKNDNRCKTDGFKNMTLLTVKLRIFYLGQ